MHIRMACLALPTLMTVSDCSVDCSKSRTSLLLPLEPAMGAVRMLAEPHSRCGALRRFQRIGSRCNVTIRPILTDLLSRLAMALSAALETVLQTCRRSQFQSRSNPELSTTRPVCL
jgi:hypothetical protein